MSFSVWDPYFFFFSFRNGTHTILFLSSFIHSFFILFFFFFILLVFLFSLFSFSLFLRCFLPIIHHIHDEIYLLLFLHRGSRNECANGEKREGKEKNKDDSAESSVSTHVCNYSPLSSPVLL